MIVIFFVCIALKILHDKLACNLKTDPLVHVQHLTTEFSLYFSKLAQQEAYTTFLLQQAHIDAVR